MKKPDIIDHNLLLSEIKDCLLPKPIQEESQIDGAITMIGGDPGEVIVRITDKTISVAVYAVEWRGPHSPVVVPKWLAKLAWQRIPASDLMQILRTIIDGASGMRRMKYRKCEYCGEIKPPEWMHGKTTCQSCAERKLGVVY